MAAIRIGAGWRKRGAEIPLPAVPEVRPCRAIEVGCTDWYIYPRSDPVARECAPAPGAKVAAMRQRIAPCAGASG